MLLKSGHPASATGRGLRRRLSGLLDRQSIPTSRCGRLCTAWVPADISQLPVMEQEGSRRLIGLLRRRDIIRAYDVAVAKQAHDRR